MNYMLLSIFIIILIPVRMFTCTGIRLRAHNGSIIYARTLEFGQNLESTIIVIPRNYQFTATGPQGALNGLKWKSKYAVVGANALNLANIVDGINEKGLTGGLFYFPQYAQYQKVTPQEASQSLASWELMTWILSNFATVDQVKKALPKIKVSTVTLAQEKSIEPLHAIVHDASGDCIVIEYVKGILHLYNNPLGVITNSPTFDWHVTNLRNYVNLSSVNVPKVKLSTIALTPFGQGSGMLGLPGDFTPPSRFIRAVAFSQTVIKPQTEHQAISTAFHILNLFDIPKGIIRDKHANRYSLDYTQWTIASDTKNKRYYFHTYNNRQIKMVNLLKIDLHNRTIISIPMAGKQEIIDVTPS